jgi:hypothetical protein
MSYESAHRPIFDMPESGLINTSQWMPEYTSQTDTRTPQEKYDDLILCYRNAYDLGDDALVQEYEDMIETHLANNPELNQ